MSARRFIADLFKVPLDLLSPPKREPLVPECPPMAAFPGPSSRFTAAAG